MSSSKARTEKLRLSQGLYKGRKSRNGGVHANPLHNLSRGGSNSSSRLAGVVHNNPMHTLPSLHDSASTAASAGAGAGAGSGSGSGAASAPQHTGALATAAAMAAVPSSASKKRSNPLSVLAKQQQRANSTPSRQRSRGELLRHKLVKNRSKLYFLVFHGRTPTRSMTLVKFCLVALIFVSLMSILSETVRFPNESLNQTLLLTVTVVEIIFTAVFTIEYIIRVLLFRRNPHKGPRNRIMFVLSLPALVDIVTILPFYVYLASGLRFHLFSIDGLQRGVRSIRLLRMFRFLRYSPGLRLLLKVMYLKRDNLMTSIVTCIMTATIVSVSVFVWERPHNPMFENMMTSMWWSIITLTTVGYGDIVPITPAGRLLGSVGALIGIGLFTLPAGIIVSGFDEQLKLQQKRRGASLTRLNDIHRQGLQRLAFRKWREVSEQIGEVQRLMAPQDKDAVTYRRRQAARDFLRACSGDIYLAMSMLAFAAKNR